jgi:LCP family protein required for cell wall assembly
MRRNEYSGRVSSRIPHDDWYWTRESMAKPAKRDGGITINLNLSPRRRARRDPRNAGFENTTGDPLESPAAKTRTDSASGGHTPGGHTPGIHLAAPGQPRNRPDSDTPRSSGQPIKVGEWHFFESAGENQADFSDDNDSYRPSARSRSTRRFDSIDQKLTLCLSAIFVVFLFATVITFTVVLSNNIRGRKASLAAAPTTEATQPAAAALPKDRNQTKILLLGSDQRDGDNGFRTDVIILLVLDSDKNTVTAVSFPRDLWVNVPGMYEMKINQVFALGGFDSMAALFEDNFKVKPDYYVMTNFDGFSQFIDNRGGIDVDVAQKLTDACDVPQQRGGFCTVDPGTVHMDGPFALWYVRSRHTSSDIDRLRRAQEILYATLKKTINLGNLGQLQEMKDELGNNIDMNLTLDKTVSLIPITLNVLQDSSRIHAYAINEDEATEMLSWNGMWILLPDKDKVVDVLRNADIELVDAPLP